VAARVAVSLNWWSDAPWIPRRISLWSEELTNARTQTLSESRCAGGRSPSLKGLLTSFILGCVGGRCIQVSLIFGPGYGNRHLNWIDIKGLLLVCLIFVPLEQLLALRPDQKIFRRGWLTDVGHVFATGLLVKFGLALAVLAISLAAGHLIPAKLRAAVAAQPVWLQFTEIVLLADLGFYLAHRAFHAVPVLWRIHAVHHSIEELDWLAAHRVHPIDQILTKTASFLPVFALGFSLEPFLLFALIFRWQALLIHSNVRIGYGPLRWIIASPQFHHWHHANCPETLDKNFAGQLPIWDLLFGTLHLPRGRMPQRYGTDDPVPRSYLAQLAYPFMKRDCDTPPCDDGDLRRTGWVGPFPSHAGAATPRSSADSSNSRNGASNISARR
jgi:sterol desaturase/sphingolipid hydroxylase (fatty acid hydroxylase superfamily)